METQHGGQLHWSLLPLKASCCFWMVYTESTWEHWLCCRGTFVAKYTQFPWITCRIIFKVLCWCHCLYHLPCSVLSFCCFPLNDKCRQARTHTHTHTTQLIPLCVNCVCSPGYSMTGSWICMMGPGFWGGTDTRPLRSNYSSVMSNCKRGTHTHTHTHTQVSEQRVACYVCHLRQT